MLLVPEKLAELEFESVQQEKRDKLNSRLQVWGVLISLVGASGVVAGVQSGAIAYAVALYPLLAVCIARYAAHSEGVLDQLKVYLLQLEEKAGYEGYEHFNKASGHRDAGGHLWALRDAILVTDALAVGAVAWRLWVVGAYLWVGVLVLLAAVVIWVTLRWLNASERVGKRGRCQWIS